MLRRKKFDKSLLTVQEFLNKHVHKADGCYNANPDLQRQDTIYDSDKKKKGM